MNGIIGETKFNSLSIIKYSGARYLIILSKHTQKMRNKMTKPVRWSKQGGDFNIKYTR